jgi:hypothetical protein
MFTRPVEFLEFVFARIASVAAVLGANVECFGYASADADADAAIDDWV